MSTQKAASVDKCAAKSDEAACMMIFWMALRTIKYEFLPYGAFATRYAWYLYYIPLIFIPLLMFLSVLYVGRPHSRPISRRWKLLYIPAVLLVVGMLTNDIHQLAFGFPDGLAGWNDTDYTYGPVYYAVVVWIAVLFIAIMVIVFARCAVPANRKKIWVPALPFTIGIIYTLLIVLNIHNVLTEMLRVPEMGCVLFAAFMESLIIVHLFPSNDSYSDFWNASSIGAGIMDEEGVIHYESEHSMAVSEAQIRRAENEEVLLAGGDMALRSHRIQGGFCYWTKDISEINQLKQELADMGNVLAEENAMLKAENKIMEERTGIRRQTALYDGIAQRVGSQLEKISSLLDLPAQNEEAFKQNMKYACILNAYVKRCSNLLLLSQS